MEGLIQQCSELLAARGVAPATADMAARGIGVVALLLVAWLANLVTKRVLLRLVAGVVRRSNIKWDDALVEAGVFTRLSHIVPALVIRALGDDVLGRSAEVAAWLDSVVTLYLLVIGLGVFSALMNAVHAVGTQSDFGSRVPLKGFIQAVKLVGFVIGGIFILSVLFGRSPVYFLSSLGALTAVLLLVFKDAILGFVAGIQISVNQMVRVGDWIQMPKAGADGDVIDVSLTTVKVRNWNKTITTIPTYSLISDSFVNWRGMHESGGRRIKRAVHVDMQTVRFADEVMLERWRKIALLKPYLDGKTAEIAEENKKLGVDLGVLGNGRRLTNLGTFRAYVSAYLRANPILNQEMTFLVRHLDPTAQGLPLEFYVFCTDKRWPYYESIQADIMDHLLAIIPEFGLRIFQAPSGHDLRELGAAVATTRS